MLNGNISASFPLRNRSLKNVLILHSLSFNTIVKGFLFFLMLKYNYQYFYHERIASHFSSFKLRNSFEVIR